MLVFEGAILHSKGISNPLEILKDHVLGVSHGKIIFVRPSTELQNLKLEYEFSEDCVTKLQPYEFLMPGMVDAHIHAPQYPNCGLGLDLPLLPWLEKYTFPLEARYQDLEFAEKVYSEVVDHCLQVGTTTAQYFSSIHVDSNLLLCRLAEQKGQRALVGKCSMNQNAPENYSEASDGISNARTFVTLVLKEKYDLVEPVITPRFAINCDMEFMKGLANIAKTYDVRIQSHLSENKNEVSFVKELFPDCDSYTDVYDKAGLLTSKTTMAHGIHLDESEVKLLRDKQTSICHCPNSNFSLRSGICNVRNLQKNNIKVGMGSDISGGFEIHLLDAVRGSIQASNVLSMQGLSDPIDFRDAFHLATLGGAEAVSLGDRVGSFEAGKDFDALVISLKTPASRIRVFDFESLEELLQKFLFLGDDRNIKEVYVAGRLVHSTC